MRREIQKSGGNGKKISAQEIFSRNIKIAGLIILIIHLASAGEIYGKIYRWDTFELIDAVVEIRNSFVQRIIAEDGTYSFVVEDGDYVIIAKWRDLIAIENVTVKGKVRFDLILVPNIDVKDEKEDNWFAYLAILITSSILIFLYYLKRKEGKVEETKILPEDLSSVLEVIKKEGGRITQKELRKRLGYSEAKMSLIVADLERRGLIEKVKKGRGNIIFLKK